MQKIFRHIARVKRARTRVYAYVCTDVGPNAPFLAFFHLFGTFHPSTGVISSNFQEFIEDLLIYHPFQSRLIHAYIRTCAHIRPSQSLCAVYIPAPPHTRNPSLKRLTASYTPLQAYARPHARIHANVRIYTYGSAKPNFRHRQNAPPVHSTLFKIQFNHIKQQK